MAKDTFYFSHDYNTRTDIKIKKLIQKNGYVGYGIFWAIVEDLYNNANALPADYESIAYDLREDEKLIISVINDFDLFIIDNNIISSESVERRLILRDAKTDAARAAALARWEKEREKKRLKDANASNNNANALQTECKGNAIKENKENETKENKFNLPLKFSEIIQELKIEGTQKNLIIAQYKTTSQIIDKYIDYFAYLYTPENDEEVYELHDKRTHFKNFLKLNWNKIENLDIKQASGESITISEPIKTRLKELYNVQHALSFFERYIKQYRVDEVQALKDFERAKEQQVNFLTIQSRISNNQKIYNY